MKKIIFIGIFLLSLSSLNAQVNKHALGLRLGGNNKYNGVEASYQGGINNTNRIEVDLGFSSGKDYSAFSLTSIYHWVWDLSQGFNVYTGPGLGVGIVDSNLSLSLGGQVGAEYDFNTINVPILLSIDFRPMFNITGNSGFGWGLALGLRYTW